MIPKSLHTSFFDRKYVFRGDIYCNIKSGRPHESDIYERVHKSKISEKQKKNNKNCIKLTILK